MLHEEQILCCLVKIINDIGDVNNKIDDVEDELIDNLAHTENTLDTKLSIVYKNSMDMIRKWMKPSRIL